MNRFDTDWRWQATARDSPWYPSLIQFRQPKPGAWDAVVVKVTAALDQLSQGGEASRPSLPPGA
jgi:hypothetical protein